jgi:hypothetical protein
MFQSIQVSEISGLDKVTPSLMWSRIDKVDIISYTSKSKRIVAQIKDFCAILSGLVVSGDYKLGQELFANRAFNENEEFFKSVFEVGRR